jgi:hypothetical protein
MHVFQIILKKMKMLQKKTHLEVIRNCNHRTEQLSKELGRAYSTIDALLPDDVDYDELQQIYKNLMRTFQTLQKTNWHLPGCASATLRQQNLAKIALNHSLSQKHQM